MRYRTITHYYSNKIDLEEPDEFDDNGLYADGIAQTALDFDEQVNYWLEKGWELYGNPYIFPANENNYECFCQAMIIKLTK